MGERRKGKRGDEGRRQSLQTHFLSPWVGIKTRDLSAAAASPDRQQPLQGDAPKDDEQPRAETPALHIWLRRTLCKFLRNLPSISQEDKEIGPAFA